MNAITQTKTAPSSTTDAPADMPFAPAEPTPQEPIDLGEQVSKLGNVPCQRCDTPFFPRSGSGGKKPKYCSVDCRRAADREKKANAPNARQREGQRAESPAPEPAPKTSASAASPDDKSSDFDWFGDINIAVPTQMAIAVYENPRGDIVIRQESPMHPDEDPFVVVKRDNLMLVIDRLCDIAGIGSAGR